MLTPMQISELRECGYGRTEIDRLAKAVAAGSEPCVSTTPNGRDIRLVLGGFSVQPANDNYWMTVASIDDAMDAFENPAAYRQ